MSHDCLVQDTLAEAEEHRNAAQIREQRLTQQLAQNEQDRQTLSQVPVRSHQTKLLCQHPRLLAVHCESIDPAGACICARSSKQSARLYWGANPGFAAKAG